MKKYFLLAVLLTLSLSAFADEGMWLANMIDKALEKQMQAKGLQLSAGEIYNGEGTALCDAIVSLDFGCTGSFISDQGLVITNHHCAYSDVYALSSPEHNYLEDGFWAMYANQEIPIRGKRVQILRKVIDVTEEALKLRDEQGLNGKPMGGRKLSYLLEKKYGEQSRMTASLYSMWKGSKYYMALYEEYSDVRLVAAPPVSVAAFGGDVDNWEWPQHKCDFAMYRVYAAKNGRPAEYSAYNVPLKPSRHLTISEDGYRDGDFTMVLGYPGTTDRYASSARVNYKTYVSLPILNEVRGKQMEIISSWMDRDEEVRRRYSDHFFGLSNFQELGAGEVMCYKRFGVVAEKQAQEKELDGWIAETGREEWKNLTSDLGKTYEAVAPAERNVIWYRECLVRGSRLSLICSKIHSMIRFSDKPGNEAQMRHSLPGILCQIDFRVEKELFRYTVGKYYENVTPDMWGPYQKELHERFGGDCDSLCEYIWTESALTSQDGVLELVIGGKTAAECADDPMYRFYTDVTILPFNQAVSAAEGDKPLSSLEREYTHALYRMRLEKGVVQYPDANSSLRLTYGTVGGYEPYDGIWCTSMTTPAGILAKHDPSRHDFCLKDDWKSLLETKSPQMGVNFLTDNDITGGNSGSPVLNARGEIIGLAFDGNKESLAGDSSFTKGYNKCVCVDIRFVLWTLKHYAGMYRIIDEIYSAS